jgi:hypothetical protein
MFWTVLLVLASLLLLWVAGWVLVAFAAWVQSLFTRRSEMSERERRRALGYGE